MSPSPFNMLIYALAVFRLALMFAKEHGPCGVFTAGRTFICSKARCLVEGVDCLWCWSVWIAGAAALHLWIFGGPDYLIIALALSGIAVILNQAFTQHEGK